MGEGWEWDNKGARRRQDGANCCADDGLALHRPITRQSLNLLEHSAPVRTLPRLKIEMIHYEDILSCCRQNGCINRAVHAYDMQSPQAVA